MTTDAVGGVWQYSTELALALRPLGFESVLAVLGPAPSTEQRRAIDSAPGIELIETDLPLDWLSEAASTRKAAAAVAAQACQHSVDLVHLNSPALAAGQGYPVPVIGMAHGCLATWWDAARPGRPLDPAFAWHREMMAEGLQACDLALAPSASFAEALRRVYSLSTAPGVVHNGRALPPERARVEPASDSAFTAGRLWDEVKNLSMLDAAAASLPFPLHAAGPATAPHGDTVTARHLDMIGQLDAEALAERLAQRPVFVSAATFEPFGLAVLEAAGARCALVLSDIPTFRELWDGAAIFVDAHDAQGFADAIETCLRDPHEREALGEAAHARALHYTPERMAGHMASHYRHLLAERLAA